MAQVKSVSYLKTLERAEAEAELGLHENLPRQLSGPGNKKLPQI